MSMCNVLGVLGDNEDVMWETFHAAVALADAEHARLTLAKTCENGRAYVWITPFAFGGAYVPPELDSPGEAARLLACVVEHVPAAIPVTTFVLGGDTQASLRKLLRSGCYGAVVAEACLLTHCRRLRRQLLRDQVTQIPVALSRPEHGADAWLDSHLSSNSHTEDALDAQIAEGSDRRDTGLRPGHAQRLAGAGGQQ